MISGRYVGRGLFLVASAVGLLSAAPARATDSASETHQSDANGQTAARRARVTAAVTAIDRGNRTVTLRETNGRQQTVDVPAEMKSFDSLKIGDRVNVDFYESLAISMMPPGSKPSMTERTTASGGNGAGVTGRETTVTATVVDVDPSNNTVTFKGPRGNLRTIDVVDPDAQQRLHTLKPGQAVKFTFTEARAVSITPAGH